MITFTRIGAKVKVDYGGGNGANIEPSFNVVYSADDPYIYITEATSGKAGSSNGLKVLITDISGRPSDVPEDVADWLRDNFFYKGGLSEYVGEFANYTDLTTTLPAGISGRFAFVLNDQGTNWLPGSVGGTYYGAGWYYDTGSVWSNKNDEIFEGLDKAIFVRTIDKAVDYTAISGDYVLADCTSGDINISIPLASDNTDKVINIKKIDASFNSVFINANVADLIDGVLSVELVDQYESISIVSDGSNWHII